MAATYEPIASTTLGSAAANYTFSSIPGTYTDLRVVVRAKTSYTSHSALVLEINGSAATNYSNTRLYGNGSTVTSDRFSNQTGLDVGFMPPSANEFGSIMFDVMSYANTNVYKTILSAWETQGGASGSQYVLRQVGLWRSTSAITSMKFTFNSGNIVAGSTFALYGIKAA